MANKETRIYKTDTLESLRQKSNEISLHLGDNEQLNALMADKTYLYSAGAGDTLFAGPDTSSPAKTARFEVSPAHTVDNTGGYIILEGVSSIASSYIAGAIIYQGTTGSPSWSGTIISASIGKILVRDSSGTFSISADLKVGTSSPDTIAHAKVIRIVTESYPVGIVRVYKNNSELTQDMTANGFHVANIRATITQSGSPTLTNYTEGVTIYQGDSQATQALVEANATWYGTLHSVSGGVIRVKTYNGSFNAGTLIRALGSTDTITGANHGALVPVDSTYGSYIELNTPAASGNAIKVFSLDVVAAINELQDDIGTVESLTTAANDLVLAINEHDAELGTITAVAMGTSASTVSTAIREHEDQIGNVDITNIDANNDTITGALEQLHDEVGDVTASNLGTSASNLTSAVREHEDQIGNENITSIDSGSNTITGALNQLHTEVGDLALHTNSSDLTEAINELEEDLFNAEGGTKRTRSDLLTDDTSSIVDSINELHSELFVDGTGVSFTGLSADFFKEAIEELRTELGNHAVLDTNVTTDAVSAINELENVLRDDTTQRTGYVMGTNANNIIAAINEIETVLRGANANYTLTTAAQNVRDAIIEHESQIGNMVFGTGGPVDAANSTDLSGAVRVLDAEIGDTSYTGADLTTAIKNTQDDILVSGSLTTLNTTNKFIQGAINEIEADLFNSGNAGSGGSRREMSDLKTADKTSILDAINEIYDDIHTSGSVTLGTSASHLVGAINEIEGVFDASTYEISAGSNAFNVTSGTFTIDSAGDVILDSNSGNITLKAGGAQFGEIDKVSGTNNILIKSGSSTMLTGNGANATFANNLTVTNNLIVNNDVDIEGNVDVNGSIETDGLSINGTTVTATATELNVMDGGTSATSTTLVDADRLVVNDNGTMKQVGLQNFETYFESALDTLPNVTTVGALNSGSITSGFGNINIGASTITTTGSISGGAITGTSFIIGLANISEAELETIDSVTAGTVSASKAVVVDANKDVTGFRNITLTGNIDVDGTANLDAVDIDGTLDVALGSTLHGAVSITNNTASSSTTTGALTVVGGVGIGEDLYIAGNLYVEGDSVTLNTETLTVEDTLVLAGNNLSSEPSTGGFGFEVGPITSPSGVAAGVTGAHSIVYNYGHNNGDGTYGRWEADGSLILSSATLATPQVEGTDFGPNDNLTFSAGLGLSETVTKTGATIVTNYINTDRGSSQSIFKTFTINSTSTNDVVADSNSDTLNLRGLDAITLTSVPGTDTISIDHDDFGTPDTYGQTGTQDGQYIKSIITNAQGHVTGVTSADFDTRYQATNPSFEIKVNNTKVDDVFPGDKIDLIEGVGIDIAGALDGTESNITISHQDTSSVSNLTENHSGNTFIQDLAFTFDTFGHVTGATATEAAVTIPTIGNGTFTVSGSSGLSGSGSMTANQTGNSSAGLVNTDKGSSQYIFKNIAVRNLADTVLGTVVADGNNDTLYLDAGNSGITLSVSAGSDHISINHADTSNQGSVNNSGRTYIQDITLDTYGHITAISSATESYVYTPPTYDGDDINIDTGALTGATVISDLDFNITTNTLGHVTDANATIATRNIGLPDLGFAGWDLHVNGTKRLDVGNGGVANWKDGNHITATYDGGVSLDHNLFTSGGTFVGGNNNGIVIEDFYIDSYGHVRSVGTVDLDSRYDNYQHWHLTADSGGTAQIDTNETVDIAGGTAISTARSGNQVTVNFVDPGYLTSQRTATLDVQGNSTNPYVRLNDGTSDHVRIIGSGIVTTTGSESADTITIHAADTNTDINVNDTNLRARLAGLNPAQGVVYIGDSGNDLDLRIRGNLRVEGTQTIMNTETVTTEDNKIELNSNATSTPTEDAGLIVNRGSLTNAEIYWSEANDRWYFTGDSNGTVYPIPKPSESDVTRFYVRDDSNSVATITKDEVLAIDGGTAIGTNFITAPTGESDRLEISHSDVTNTSTTSSNTTLGNGAAFSVVSGVAVNSQGHVTGVTTKPFTLPTFPTYGVATNTTLGLVKLFSNTDNPTAANSVSSTAGRTYGVQLNSSNQMVVNVPWSDTDTNTDTNTQNQYSLAIPASTTKARLTGSGHNGNTTHDIEFVGSGATTVTRTNANKFTISSTDTNTNTDTIDMGDGFKVSDSAGTDKFTVTENEKLRFAGSGATSVSFDATNQKVTFTSANDNTITRIREDSGTYRSGDLTLQSGTNVTISEPSAGVFNISSTDTNTDTNSTYDHSFVDNGNNVIHRLQQSSPSVAHDLQYVAGTNITLTPSGDDMTIATTAEVNQNAFSTFELGTYTVGGGGTDITANSKSTEMKLQFWAESFTTAVNNTSKIGTVRLQSDQRSQISKMGTIGTGNMTIDASSTGYIYFDSHSGTSDTTGTHELRFSAGGQIDADGDIIAFSSATASDAKLKTNVNKVENALDKVSQLDGVTFEWIRDGKESAGVIAQNVEEVLPSAVKEVESLKVEGETHKSVDYNQLSALFIEAIKELKEENKLLRAEIESLKDINS